MQYPAEEETVLILLERVNEAQRLAARELKEMQAQDPRHRKRKRADQSGGDNDNEEEQPSASSSIAASNTGKAQKNSKNGRKKVN